MPENQKETRIETVLARAAGPFSAVLDLMAAGATLYGIFGIISLKNRIFPTISRWTTPGQTIPFHETAQWAGFILRTWFWVLYYEGVAILAASCVIATASLCLRGLVQFDRIKSTR